MMKSCDKDTCDVYEVRADNRAGRWKSKLTFMYTTFNV